MLEVPGTQAIGNLYKTKDLWSTRFNKDGYSQANTNNAHCKPSSPSLLSPSSSSFSQPACAPVEWAPPQYPLSPPISPPTQFQYPRHDPSVGVQCEEMLPICLTREPECDSHLDFTLSTTPLDLSSKTSYTKTPCSGPPTYPVFRSPTHCDTAPNNHCDSAPNNQCDSAPNNQRDSAPNNQCDSDPNNQWDSVTNNQWDSAPTNYSDSTTHPDLTRENHMSWSPAPSACVSTSSTPAKGRRSSKPTQTEKPKRGGKKVARNKDEAVLIENGIYDISVKEAVELPLDVVNERMKHLAEDKQKVIRDVRRRGKNKGAAQNCRQTKENGMRANKREIDELKALLDRGRKKDEVMVQDIKSLEERASKLERDFLEKRNCSSSFFMVEIRDNEPILVPRYTPDPEAPFETHPLLMNGPKNNKVEDRPTSKVQRSMEQLDALRGHHRSGELPELVSGCANSGCANSGCANRLMESPYSVIKGPLNYPDPLIPTLLGPHRGLNLSDTIRYRLPREAKIAFLDGRLPPLAQTYPRNILASYTAARPPNRAFNS